MGRPGATRDMVVSISGGDPSIDPHMGFRVEGLGFRVDGLGFRVQGLGFRPSSRDPQIVLIFGLRMFSACVSYAH